MSNLSLRSKLPFHHALPAILHQVDFSDLNNLPRVEAFAIVAQGTEVPVAHRQLFVSSLQYAYASIVAECDDASLNKKFGTTRIREEVLRELGLAIQAHRGSIEDILELTDEDVAADNDAAADFLSEQVVGNGAGAHTKPVDLDRAAGRDFDVVTG